MTNFSKITLFSIISASVLTTVHSTNCMQPNNNRPPVRRALFGRPAAGEVNAFLQQMRLQQQQRQQAAFNRQNGITKTRRMR